MRSLTIGLLACVFTLGLGFHASAVELPLRLEGRTTSGKPCWLQIDEWVFDGGTAWFYLRVKARSNWQLETHPPVSLKKSSTPFALFGSSKDNYDRMAISLNPQDLSPKAIENYNFQTWDENRGGLIQEYCRFN